MRAKRRHSFPRLLFQVVIGAFIVLAVSPLVIGSLAAGLATIIGLIALPIVLLVVVVLAIVVALVAIAVAGGILTLPAWVAWKSWRASRSSPEEPYQRAERDAERIRRRFVAGELSDTQYRDAMLTNLKERFTAGDLDVSDYEAEVERVVRVAAVTRSGRGHRRQVARER